MGKTARRASSTDQHPIGRLIIALGLTAIAAFMLASRVSFDPTDPPTHTVWPANAPVRNVCGPVGAWTAYQLVKLFGVASWMVVGAVLLHAMLVLWGRRVGYASLRLVGILMLAGATAGFQALILPKSGPFPGLAGGVIGQTAAVELGARFGPVGTAVWLVVLGGVGRSSRSTSGYSSRRHGCWGSAGRWRGGRGRPRRLARGRRRGSGATW